MVKNVKRTMLSVPGTNVYDPTSLIKEDGSADATYQYTDFGETTISGDDQAGNEVCYTGGIYDQSTGLYYLNARYYNPGDGRFVTEDSYRGEVS